MHRNLDVVYVREFKGFTSQFGKKSKEDYLLNVNKIIKDKFNSKFVVPNKVQSFLINYEIKKLLDKAIFIKNEKYTRIIYLNSNMSISTVRNSMAFINDEYHPIRFDFTLVEPKEFDDDGLEIIKGLKIIRTT
jgi:hypothetical protein